MSHVATYDISLKHSSTWLICGQTGSGKNTFVSKIIKEKENLFYPRQPKFVIVFYKTWQVIYDDWKRNQNVHLFIEGIPEEKEIRNIFSVYKKNGGCIAIFDDLQNEVNETILNCFTVFSHHYDVTIFLLVQSLFLENKIYRVCSLNAHYIVLMKNKRDGQSVTYLARQISPYNTKYITESYLKATKNPFSYLLFDMRQETKDLVRLRSNIFSDCVSIFVECNERKIKRKNFLLTTI